MAQHGIALPSMTSTSSPAIDATNLQTLKTRNPLFQQDIFLCILDCLVAEETGFYRCKATRRVLFSLARTCRAFSEPSLDRLWYSLDSLEPLVRCYATELSDERAKAPVPTPSEWVTIDRYSRRIRELRIDPSTKFSQCFLQATSFSPLLTPNLRLLEWHVYVYHLPHLRNSLAFIQRFLSPSLVSLSVTPGGTDDAVLQSFLARYPFLCPNLTSIVINHRIHPGDVSRGTIKSLSRAITYYQHLECLDISTVIDDVALMHVATSQKLKKVALVLHPDKSILHKASIPCDIVPFRYVEDLSLEVWDLHFVTTLLRIQDQRFHSFELRDHSPPTMEVVCALFTALASGQRTRTLRSILLHRYVYAERRDEFTMRYHASYETLRPLSSLCHLRDLDIHFDYWFSIDDDELASLVHNWPLLRRLSLSYTRHIHEYPWRSAKYITFKGILSLLRCCPDLCSLSLPLDAREVPMDGGDVVCNPNFARLEFSKSPIGDVDSVVVFFRRHFPSVTSVYFSFDDEDSEEIRSYVQSWVKVNDCLFDFDDNDTDS